MDARYGSFLIYVLRRPGSESIYKTQEGQPVKPDPEASTGTTRAAPGRR